MPKQKLFLVASNDIESPTGFKIEGVAERHRWYIGDEDIKLGEVEVEVPHPSNLTVADLRLKAIMTLQEKQKNVLANAQMSVNLLQEKIQSLLQLTYVEPTHSSPTDEEIIEHVQELYPEDDYVSPEADEGEDISDSARVSRIFQEDDDTSEQD